MARDPQAFRKPNHARPNLLPNPLARFCLECLYPLRSLSENRCPECAQPFDPKDPATFSPTAKRLAFGVPTDAICALVFSLPMVLLMLDLLTGTGQPWCWSHGDMHVILWPLLVSGLLVFLALNALPKHKRSFSELAAAFAVFVGLGLIGLDMFFHGQGGMLLSLFILCSSFALTLVTGVRALQSRSWWSRRLAVSAMLIVCFGMLAMLMNIPLHNNELIDYWTYWIWTAQRW